MNRLIVAWKRILHRKLYWCMLGVLLILTGIYALLPAKSQSTEIRVAVYLEDTSAYTTQFKEELDASASLYQFYYVDASTDVIRDVQAGDAECGFVLPDGFFSGYIAGSGEPKVSLYETSASTLSSAICETFFHYIFNVASPQILVDTIDDAALSEELKSRMQAYMNSDTIFRMSSVTDGAYDYKENTYRIQLPIYECTCLLVLFASLFSLMLFLQDQERGIYIALSGKHRYGILCTGLLAGILPIYGIGMLCNGITYGTATLLQVTLVSLLAYLLSLVLSVFIKKSRTLAKWIPVLLLITIVYFFVNYIL